MLFDFRIMLSEFIRRLILWTIIVSIIAKIDWLPFLIFTVNMNFFDRVFSPCIKRRRKVLYEKSVFLPWNYFSFLLKIQSWRLQALYICWTLIAIYPMSWIKVSLPRMCSHVSAVYLFFAFRSHNVVLKP